MVCHDVLRFPDAIPPSLLPGGAACAAGPLFWRCPRTFRDLRAAAIIVIGLVGAACAVVAISLAVAFLLSAAAGYLCLLFLVGLVGFIWTALVRARETESAEEFCAPVGAELLDRKSTHLNSSH